MGEWCRFRLRARDERFVRFVISFAKMKSFVSFLSFSMHFYWIFIQTRWGQIRIEWVVYNQNNIKYSNIRCRGAAMQKYLLFKAI